MTKSDLILSKILSARFIMAILFSVTACIGFLRGILPVEAFSALIGAVVTAYFLKGKEDDKKPTSSTETKTTVSETLERPNV